MKNKNILFVAQYYYPEKISSGVIPYELSVELAKEFNVYALVGYPKEYLDDGIQINKKEKINNIEVKRVKYLSIKRSHVIGRIINYLSFSFSIAVHPSLFRKCDYYISYTNPPLLPFITTLYAKLFKKKSIVVIFDLYPDMPIKLGIMDKSNVICKMFNGIYNYIFNNAYKIIAISNEMKDYLISQKNINSNKVKMIPNWYKKLECVKHLSSDDKLKIFYGGNMGLAQELETLMNTILLLNSDERFEFYFIGHGVNKNYVIETVKKNKITNCIIMDFLPKEQYDQMLKECDFAVVTLKQEIAGLGAPSKVYSYLSAGKPIIAIVPQTSDIVDDIEHYDNGIYIAYNNEKELAEKLIHFYENKDDIKKMGINSQKLFHDKYDIFKIKDEYINLIRGEEK